MAVSSDRVAAAVPLLDVPAHQAPFIDALRELCDQFVASGRYVLGPYVESFEAKLAAYCGVKHAIGVSSGTDALLAALMALDIGASDEVITTPFTFFATGGTVARVGAKPVFVDIDLDTFNIDPGAIEAAVTEHTRAIVPVHLYGQCADMDAIASIAARHKLHIIEDAAQAIGARDARGRRAGAISDIGCLSFYPTKNLPAMGDAGACLTNDDALAAKLRSLRNHGQTGEYEHALIGGNFRIDAFQAAVLELKLPHLDAWNAARRKLAARYDAALEDGPIVAPTVAMSPGSRAEPVYHQYTVRVPGDGRERRDALLRHLAAERVGHRVYYPLPLHLQPCFASLGYQRGDLPSAEAAADQVISLPIYPELTEAQQSRVIDVLRAFSV